MSPKTTVTNATLSGPCALLEKTSQKIGSLLVFLRIFKMQKLKVVSIEESFMKDRHNLRGHAIGRGFCHSWILCTVHQPICTFYSLSFVNTLT